ncbi:hypothetical protein ABIE67_009586 [Streptomyces sp. V4I8]
MTRKPDSGRGSPARVYRRRQGTQRFAEVGDIVGGPGSEQSVQAPQSGAGGRAQSDRRDLIEDVQGALGGIGWLVGCLGLGEHECGGRPPGGAGRACGRGDFGAHGPGRCVPGRGALRPGAGRVPPRRTRNGPELRRPDRPRVPSAPCPEQRSPPGRGPAGRGWATEPRRATAPGPGRRGLRRHRVLRRRRRGQVAGVAGHHALRSVRPRGQGRIAAPVRGLSDRREPSIGGHRICPFLPAGCGDAGVVATVPDHLGCPCRQLPYTSQQSQLPGLGSVGAAQHHRVFLAGPVVRVVLMPRCW